METDIISKFRNSYCEVILQGDAERAEKVIDQGLSAGIIPSKLYLEVLMPAQVEIGARWHRSEVNIPQEHIATQITLRQLARLRGMLKTRLKLISSAYLCR